MHVILRGRIYEIENYDTRAAFFIESVVCTRSKRGFPGIAQCLTVKAVNTALVDSVDES